MQASRWLLCSLLVASPGLRAQEAAPPPATAPLLRAGPMLGWVALRSAAVWVQTERPARVQLRVTPQGHPEAARLTPERRTREEEDCAWTELLERLEPGTTYEYELYLDGQRVTRPWPLTLTTPALWPAQPADVTLLAGSCAYIHEPPYENPARPPASGYRILETMGGERADAMIWLGDNVYLREVDFDSPAGIFARYRHDRALPEMQRLLAAMPQLAIWDDHDYGPNDGDRTYPLKEAALAAFQRYWPAISRGLPGVPGVFHRVGLGDVDLFLLDDRWYRDPNGWPEGPGKRFLGEAQLAWLQGALLGSRASFKLIVGGNQFLNPGSRYETMARYPQEQSALLDWIVARRIEGVVFLSGDRHHGELLRMERPGSYPLYELTTSPLTSGAHTFGPENPEWTNSLRVAETLVMQRNYAILKVSGPAGARRLALELRDEGGGSLWRREVTRQELTFPRPPEPHK